MNKHLIFTNGRSGSNYLANLLNQHPHITNYGEVLGDWTIPYQLHSRYGLGGKLDRDYLEFLYRSSTFFFWSQCYSAIAHWKSKKPVNFKRWNQIKSLGIKDFSIHFHRKNIQNYLVENESLLIINLYRENSLKRLISLINMQSTGVVKTTQNLAVQKITLDLDYVKKELPIYEQEKQKQLTLIEQINPARVFNLKYEDYFSSPESQQKYNQQIFDFLQVENFSSLLQSSQKKILDGSLAQIIDNYDELKLNLENTEYEKYLD